MSGTPKPTSTYADADADADAAESTVRSYAGDLALFLTWAGPGRGSVGGGEAAHVIHGLDEATNTVVDLSRMTCNGFACLVLSSMYAGVRGRARRGRDEGDRRLSRPDADARSCCRTRTGHAADPAVRRGGPGGARGRSRSPSSRSTSRSVSRNPASRWPLSSLACPERARTQRLRGHAVDLLPPGLKGVPPADYAGALAQPARRDAGAEGSRRRLHRPRRCRPCGSCPGPT